MISIHALLAESDFISCELIPFNASSIHALRAEIGRYPQDALDRFPPISIHALLAESDHSGLDGRDVQDEISIHALLAESDRTGSGILLR